MEVWIEPKWNWDFFHHLLPHQLLQLCLNWTKVELRRDCKPPGIYNFFKFVWIEPKWNWDSISGNNISRFHEVSLNWTKVELRPPPHHKGLLPHNRTVWIEPKWNWDISAVLCEENKSLCRVWIEPKWNWDFLQLEGIMTSINKGLNWTKVELRRIYSYNWYCSNRRVWIEPKWNWDKI